MSVALHRKNFVLDQNKIRRAKRILGCRTETETINRALDLVVFRRELIESLDKTRGRGGVRRV